MTAERGCFLAVDTATQACAAALWLDGAVQSSIHVDVRGHTRELVPMIRTLLAEAGCTPARLDGFACGVGPGSFTGVRIGVGVIKGMAMSLDRPVVAVSSLATLALPRIRTRQVQVLAAFDARLGELYVGAYGPGGDGRSLEPVGNEQVLRPEALPRQAAGRWEGVGSAWGPYRVALSSTLPTAPERIEPDALPSAVDTLALALPMLKTGQGDSADQLAPCYLRQRVALTLQEQAERRARAAD